MDEIYYLEAQYTEVCNPDIPYDVMPKIAFMKNRAEITGATFMGGAKVDFTGK